MYRQDTKMGALRLRRQGKSYNEISAELKVPKSTLRTWLARLVLSDKARRRLSGRIKAGGLMLIRRNKQQTYDARLRAQEIQSQSKSKVHTLARKDLLVIGAVLYWAEGYKRIKLRNGSELTAHPISFVNSDPSMIRAFITFLTTALSVNPQDIRLTMRLYRSIKEVEAKQYWRHVTGLDDGTFRNSTFLVTGASKGKRPFNRLPYGTLQVAVYSTEKFHELIGLIEGVKNRLKMV